MHGLFADEKAVLGRERDRNEHGVEEGLKGRQLLPGCAEERVRRPRRLADKEATEFHSYVAFFDFGV